MTDPIIRFDKVCKRFGQHEVLKDLSFDIEKGETITMMGPSGCGKSTVLRCINGLEKIESGAIEVRGVNIADSPQNFNWNAYRAGIGIVFQQFNLFPHLNVLKNITLAPIKVKKMTKTDAEDLAMGLLKRVGLEDKAHRHPSNLSGGEKQRVAIARALAMSSDILLLDEPTSALDPLMSAEVLHTIQDLSHQGITLVVVTHEVEFACRVSDRIFFLYQGALAAQGPPSQMVQDMDHPVAKQYFDLIANR